MVMERAESEATLKRWRRVSRREKDMKEEEKKKKGKIRLDSVLQRNYILFTAGYHVIMRVGMSE